MTQMTLFDDYGPIITIEKEKKMTWSELYDYLNSQKDNNPELFNQHVMVHNIETGDEYPCETTVFDDNNRLVLSICNE
jgi:hypothetical protein